MSDVSRLFEAQQANFAKWEIIKDVIDQQIDLMLNYRQSGHPGGSRSKVHYFVSLLLSGAMRWDIRHPEKRFGDRFVLVAGHYEGFDERVRRHLATDEVSVGDFVLTGGELPAMLVADAVARIRRLLQLGGRYQVLFLQGGASQQFAEIPLNLLPEDGVADYIDTGRVQFIYREVYFDRFGLWAAMLARYDAD